MQRLCCHHGNFAGMAFPMLQLIILCAYLLLLHVQLVFYAGVAVVEVLRLNVWMLHLLLWLLFSNRTLWCHPAISHLPV